MQCLQELDEFGVRIEGKRIPAPAAVDIDLYAEWKGGNEGELKESALMAFVVENVASVDRGRTSCRDRVPGSDNRIRTPFWTNRPNEFRREVEEICREIQENVYRAMKLCVSVAIGCYVDTPDLLYQSYECAAEALKYRYSRGMGAIFDCEEQICEADFKELSGKLKRSRWRSGVVTENRWKSGLYILKHGSVREWSEETGHGDI